MTEPPFPGHRGHAPVVLLSCAFAAHAARGKALALGFAARGWDVCLLSGGDDDATAVSAVSAAVEATGRRALVLPTSLAALATEAGAAALLARCDAALGRPRCLVNAPYLSDADCGDVGAQAGAEDGAGDQSAGLVRLTEANLATALALTQALHRAWGADEDASARSGRPAETAATSGAHAANRSAPIDVVAINLVDSGIFDLQAERLAFLLTASGLHAATPALARALAPRMRVVAVATPSERQGVAHRVDHAALSDAVCYLASASTITGSTLLIDGGLHAGDPIAAESPERWSSR